jgi:hypothetical protein
MKLDIDSWITTDIKFYRSVLYSNISNDLTGVLQRIWCNELLIYIR